MHAWIERGAALAAVISQLNARIGQLVSWLVLAMVLLISYDVMMRYLFQSGSVALQELEWHLFAVLFLFASAYTLQQDGHVRVDVLYNSRFMTDRHRAMVNVFGGLFLLLPFCLLILFHSWPFVHNAYLTGETSPDPGGLPYRFAIKGAIIIGFALLLLQGIADILRNLALIYKKE